MANPPATPAQPRATAATPAATPSHSSSNTTTTNDRDIASILARIEELEGQVAEAHSNNTSQQKEVKIGKVEPFSGERGTLKVFLAKLRIYFSNNSGRIVTEQDKVLTASSFLTGEAMRWFAPYVTERIENNDEQLSVETIQLFSSFAYFEEKLHQLFGSVNEELEAIHRIKSIRQYGSVGEYISKFLQVSGYLKWSDQGLRDQFYDNLKDNVKDRISQIMPRPDTFKRMMEAASQIDMQLYTRRMERGNYQHRPQPRQHANTSQRRTRDKDGDVIMQMNATLTKEEKDKLIKKKACFNCGIPGHFANKCRKPKKSQGTANHGTRQQIATAIHVYTPDESSTEEISETDDEIPEQYKRRIQQQAEKQKRLQKEIQQALDEPMNTDEEITEATQRYKKIEIPEDIGELLGEWTTLTKEEIRKAIRKPMDQEKEIALAIQRRNTTKMKSAIKEVKDIDIQAPVATHEDAHRMLLRNKQSHEVRRKRAPITMTEVGATDDADSESTDYEDSSLIESFHTQLAFQDGDEKAINQPVLNREQQKPRLDPYERIKEQLAEIRKNNEKYPTKCDYESKATHDNEKCKSNRSWNTTWTTIEKELTETKHQGDDLCTCMPVKATCWEESQYTWKEHIERCEKCHEWTYRNCPIHEHSNKILATIYERISNSNGYRLCSGQLGHVPNCVCMHYPNLGGCNHIEVHWTTCYDDGCEFHHLSKKINQWFPKIPGIAAQSKHTCPRGNPKCKCAYEESGHPAHSDLPKEECRAVFCQYHHDGLYVSHLEEHIRAVQSYMDRHQQHHLIASTIDRKYRTIIILAEINNTKLRILLDLGATGNHIRSKLVKKLCIE